MAIVHAYTFADPEWPAARPLAIAALRSHLPVSIAVLRRLQFGRFFAASTILTNLTLHRVGQDDPFQSHGRDAPWFVAFVDRSSRPETEACLYCSWENQDETAETCNETHMHERGELMESFVARLKSEKLPDSIHEDFVPQDQVGINDTIMFGAVHEKTLLVLERIGRLHLLKGPREKVLVPYSTYIFDVDDMLHSSANDDLLQDLYWSQLQFEDMTLVRSRQEYARREKTLIEMPNVAIFSAESRAPIAWALVGLDGSLTSLHVEEAWRKRGLARLVTRKIFAEAMVRFWQGKTLQQTHVPPEPHLAQAYVHKRNEASKRLCEGLGGKLQWDVYWVRVTL